MVVEKRLPEEAWAASAPVTHACRTNREYSVAFSRVAIQLDPPWTDTPMEEEQQVPWCVKWWCCSWLAQAPILHVGEAVVVVRTVDSRTVVSMHANGECLSRHAQVVRGDQAGFSLYSSHSSLRQVTPFGTAAADKLAPPFPKRLHTSQHPRSLHVPGLVRLTPSAWTSCMRCGSLSCTREWSPACAWGCGRVVITPLAVTVKVSCIGDHAGVA